MGWFEGIDDVRLADEAAVREGLSQAVVAVAQDQSDAAQFMREHGAAVIAGHPDVRQPGRQGDPDAFGPDAGDL